MRAPVGVAEARGHVLSSCRRLAAVEVPLERALGLVLATAVRSHDDLPPFANSAMDGYALRAQDVRSANVKLRVVGSLMAGDDPGTMSVGPGEAVRIMTGAMLPDGADAVCMVEHTHGGEGSVVVERAVAVGTNVRRAGEDVAAGDRAFGPGEVLSAPHIGVLTSLGVTSVLVYPRPTVGVVSTGDELVNGPGPLPVGKIRDSNRAGLLAQLRADGFSAVDLGAVADDPDRLAETLREAASRCDVLLTSGGVSVGDRDIVRVVLEKLGGSRARWFQVAVKPGKPFAFCTLAQGGVAVFGLPGNPVSALVSYELFARPALRQMSGHRRLGRPQLSATADVEMRRVRDGRLHLVRAVVSAGDDGMLRARPSGPQGSHQMRALAAANALALLPDGDGVAAGDAVKVWLLDVDGLGAEAVDAAPGVVNA